MNAYKSSSTFHAFRRLAPAVLAVLILLPAAAQNATGNRIDCLPENEALPTIPVIESSAGMLSGTLYTVSEQVRMTAPGTGGATTDCYAQWVRAYRSVAPSNWNPPSSQLLEPMPGPTLRARVGDVVALTFLNSIDANKFPRADRGCDANNVYPANTGVAGDKDNPPDKAPDCFSGSVFTNVHFHGTHTNPNSTGDNVFLQIRPSPRVKGNVNASNAPIVTAASVQENFATFFAQCKQELMSDPGPKIWPRKWSDLEPKLQSQLMNLVEQFGVAGWAEANKNLIANGNWPQYFVGAYPYCFKLPEFLPTQTTLTQAAATDAESAHTHGKGSAETDESKAPARPLLMGQAPGTHWYHAHKHGSTTINVMNGMTGVFIIEGAYDDALNAFYGEKWTKKQPLLVIQELGSVPNLAVLPSGKFLPLLPFSVNGRIRPTISMPGQSVQMWRIANNAGRSGVYFAAPTPKTLEWMQIAQDGVQFKPENYGTNSSEPFLLTSGNRADLLVKAPKYVKGGLNVYPVLVYNSIDPSDRPPQRPGANPVTLLNVVVTPDAPAGHGREFIPTDQAPTLPSFLDDITDDELRGTKILKFASTALPSAGPPPASRHSIDGKLFDGELGAVVELNRAEEWKIVNETYGPVNLIAHPFHIHINPFQVSEVFDPNSASSSTSGTGTVTTVKGSSIVTGQGTTFTKEFRIGDFIWIKGEKPAIVVANADGTPLSDAQLTINIAAAGVPKDTAGNPIPATYTAAVPMYTMLEKSKARPEQCVLEADPQTWKPCRATVPAKDRIWWDVFPMPSGRIFTDASGKTYQIPGYFKMRSRFVDYAGYFVLHCHILAHEDRGMMTVVEVAPLQTPYSHH